MARPRTALGTSGSVRVVPQVQNEQGRWATAPSGRKPERWRARTKFRDSDGVLRDVERFAATKARAETKLRMALAERIAPSRGDDLRADMAVVDAGAVWLTKVARPDSDLSDNTRRQYSDAFNRYVRGSTITGLRLREVNRVPVLEKYLQGVADSHGTGAAKTARSVVSNIIGLAVRYKVLDHNAMREVRPARAMTKRVTERDTTRAFTRDEREAILKLAERHEGAQCADVADIVWYLAGTGVRISEALAQRWEDVDLDLGTVFVRGTKTEHSQRLLTLPGWLAARMRRRAAEHGSEGLVFPSPRLTSAETRSRPRDRRNVARVIRQILDEAGVPWATPHTFRRTVATLLDAAGLPIALAANQLGHADPAMTARVYLGRKGDTSAAAAVL